MIKPKTKTMVLGAGELLEAVREYLESCTELPESFFVSKAHFRGLMSKTDTHLWPGDRWDPLYLHLTLDLGDEEPAVPVASPSTEEPKPPEPVSAQKVLEGSKGPSKGRKTKKAAPKSTD